MRQARFARTCWCGETRVSESGELWGRLKAKRFAVRHVLSLHRKGISLDCRRHLWRVGEVSPFFAPPIFPLPLGNGNGGSAWPASAIAWIAASLAASRWAGCSGFTPGAGGIATTPARQPGGFVLAGKPWIANIEHGGIVEGTRPPWKRGTARR
jgi:hypothetical protein